MTISINNMGEISDEPSGNLLGESLHLPTLRSRLGREPTPEDLTRWFIGEARRVLTPQDFLLYLAWRRVAYGLPEEFTPFRTFANNRHGWMRVWIAFEVTLPKVKHPDPPPPPWNIEHLMDYPDDRDADKDLWGWECTLDVARMDLGPILVECDAFLRYALPQPQ